MLENWQVARFRSIVDPCDFALADITLLTGLNNTGKSSLLQSIVLIAQSLSSHSGNEQLVFHGPMLDLDNVRDIAQGVTSTTPLTIHFTLGPSTTKAYTPARAYSREQSYYHPGEAAILPEQSVEVTLKVVFASFHRDTYQPHSLGTAGKFMKDTLPLVKSFRMVLNTGGHEPIIFVAENIAREKFHPLHDSPRYEGRFELGGQTVPARAPMKFVRFFPVDLNQAFHGSTVRRANGYYNTSQLTDSIRQVEAAIEGMKRFFNRGIHYLGVPRSYAPMSPSSGHYSPFSRDTSVGSHGEFAATVYGKHADRTVSWYASGEQTQRNTSLADALHYWLQYLELAQRVSSEGVIRDDREWYEWHVAYRGRDELHALAPGGTGVSQVLPLLVMGLLAPEGSLLLVEQPELCLHQRAQARLGDFFVSLARCGKQCLIETHSENLVTQLRYHIVSEGGHDQKKYKIYFADKDDEANIQLTSIEISPRGNILNWPEGFFDEISYQEENLSLAYLRRKAEESREEKPRR